MRRKLIYLTLAFVLFVLAQAAGFCFVPGTDIVLYLAFGWIPYLFRVGPQLSVRWDMLVSTAVYVVLLAVGSHLFLRWLYREMRLAGAPTETPPPWKWRRTLGGLMVVLLMFAAGTAAVGITHQTVWLVRSPDPLYRKGNARMDRIRCASNLRQIGQGLQMYANENDGRLPDGLRALLASGIDVEASVFVCPALPDDEYTAATRAAAEVHATHASYVYFGKGLTLPLGPTRVLAVELLDNHEQDGVNVLYGDGGVEWKENVEAEALLIKLGFERVEMRR